MTAGTVLSPTPTSLVLVSVQVTRNPNKPSFPSPTVDVSIGSDREPGDVIAQVTATDVDADDDIFYTLLGDDVALQFFHVDDVSGEVWLRRSVADSQISMFEVNAQKYQSHTGAF